MLHSSGLVKVNGRYGQGVFEIKSQDIIEFGTTHLKPISEEMSFIYEEKDRDKDIHIEDTQNNELTPDRHKIHTDTQDKMMHQTSDKEMHMEYPQEPKIKKIMQQKLKKRPKRPCVYCGQMQSQLARHLRRHHKNEKAVSELTTMKDDKDKNFVFSRIRKSGILRENKKRAKCTENPDFLRERQQGDTDLVICGTCSGFFSRKKMWQHKANHCHSREAGSVSKIAVSASNLSVPTDDTRLGQEFIKSIVHRFHDDEIGNICRQDEMILLLGKGIYCKGKDRKIAMTDMRRVASLLKEFRASANDMTLTGKDLLHRTKFKLLEDALHTVSCKDDGTLKAGLKLSIGYLIKRCAKVMKGHYIIEGKFDEAQEIDRFNSVFELNWDFLFSKSKNQVDARRQDVLRRPKMLPVEEDVTLVRDYTVANIEKMTEDQYLQWDQSEFNRLRSLLVCRLTLFNARRGGEPCQMTLNDWHNAEKGAWIDNQMASAITDPVEK